MRNTGQFLLSMLLVLGLYSLTGCGGSATTALDLTSQPGSSVGGVTSGDFKAIRFNDEGYRDSALNSTLDITVAPDGATTTVTIGIADTEPMWGAVVELYYDPAHYSPVRSEFAGLVGNPLELASTRAAGLVALGQADIDGVQQRSGEFVTVTFANSPLRVASAAGDAHQVPVNYTFAPGLLAGATDPEAEGFAITKAATATGDPATYHIRATFAQGDGDGNGESNASDITPMVANQKFGAANAITDTDRGTAMSDYDGNGETNAADLSRLGQRIGESTTGIEILLADDGNDFATNTGTVLETLAWTAGTAAVRPPAAGTVDWDLLFRNWDGTVDVAAATAADTDGDGSVAISARAVGTGTPGPAFTDATAVITYAVGVAGVVVTGFDGMIDATTDVPFDTTTTAAELIAGEPVVLSVTSISGTYDPGGGAPTEPFNGAPSANMPQADYDDSLALVQASIQWASSTAGDSTNNEYRTTEPVVDLEATTGSSVNAGVTSDSDNPDSTAATTPEGTLTVTVPASGAFIPLALTASIEIDVLDDPDAPVFTSLTTDQPAAGSYHGLNPAGSTIINAGFNVGAALPADLNDVTIELAPTYAAGDAFTLANRIGLTYTVNPNPGVGEFTILIIPGPPVVTSVICNVPSSAAPGVVYGLQMLFVANGSVTTSSVNHPDNAFMSAGDAPVPTAFASVPSGDSLIANHDVLMITYPDPAIRRDGRVDVGGGDVTPEDAAGYADRVKNNGDSFALTSQSKGGGGFEDFPMVVVVQGNDPNTITSTTAGETVGILFRGPGALVLDLSLITFGGTADVEYAYKVFGAAANQADWPTLGTGTFTYSPTGIAPGGPAGVDYGINVFDDVNRGELTTADFSTKAVNASTIGTATSDVLFIEVSNFGFYDFDTLDPFDYAAPLSSMNTRVRFTDTADNTKTMEAGLVPVIANLGVNGNTMVLLEFTAEHFSKVGAPGWTGILDPGLSYDVTLVDPNSPASDFTFTTEMIVTGVNPN